MTNDFVSSSPSFSDRTPDNRFQSTAVYYPTASVSLNTFQTPANNQRTVVTSFNPQLTQHVIKLGVPSVQVLGWDIGGANLKASDGQSRSIERAFPLWKQPEQLAAALRGLASQFDQAAGWAVTMTGVLPLMARKADKPCGNNQCAWMTSYCL